MRRRGRFLTAEWRWLAMVNYQVDPAVLAPLVPAGTTLDLHDGRALASLVAFRFLRTRVLGVPVPGHRDFDEVNLRFYVRHLTAAGEVRRGATFVRELVPRRAIATVARLAYNEPYLAVPMRSSVPRGAFEDDDASLAFRWRSHGRWHAIAGRAHGEAAVPALGSEEAFIAEHYWGYTRQRDGGTVEYHVAHPPWRVRALGDVRVDIDVAALYGAAFAPALAAAPTSAFVAEGSPVHVELPRRL
jgi:hypothetical protein